MCLLILSEMETEDNTGDILASAKRQFIARYSKNLKNTDEIKYAFWEDKVVSSCISKTNGKYKCVFCDKYLIYASALKRHYCENHFNDIPEGIFGSEPIFSCKNCDLSFKRKHSLHCHHKKYHTFKVQSEMSNNEVCLKGFKRACSLSNMLASTQKIRITNFLSNSESSSLSQNSIANKSDDKIELPNVSFIENDSSNSSSENNSGKINFFLSYTSLSDADRKLDEEMSDNMHLILSLR